jgi:3-phosphoshikimate 1-carboxyvinyltransferase
MIEQASEPAPTGAWAAKIATNNPRSMFDTDSWTFPRSRSAGGTVRLPGSKSISNRVLLLAALSTATPPSTTCSTPTTPRVMLDALRAAGLRRAAGKRAAPVVITGLGGRPVGQRPTCSWATPARRCGPLTAALALLGGEFELSGVPRMHERPIGDLVDALRQLGCAIDYLGKDGLSAAAHAPGDGAQAARAPIQVRGDVSSQFLTALLMALPLVAEQDIVIDVVGELISKPYIEITLNLLAALRHRRAPRRLAALHHPRRQPLPSPGEIHVEGRCLFGQLFHRAGRHRRPPGPIRIEGVGAALDPGRHPFRRSRAADGRAGRERPNWLRVSRGAWPLKAIDLDCNHIPDAAMTLAVMALYADGPSTLRNIASWRVKETDRLAAMATELRKLGATGGGRRGLPARSPRRPTGSAAAIHTYDDHRVAMCFSLAAFNPAAIAGAHRRPEVRGQDLPRLTSRRCSPWPLGRRRTSR